MAWFREETHARAHLAGASAAPQRLILRGRIVTMDAVASVISDGFVAIEGNKIAQVGSSEQSLAPKFLGTTAINTNGTIYPGLIELHNHPSYNAIPLWQVSVAFPNRAVWRRDTDYKRRVSVPASLLTHDPTSEIARSVIRARSNETPGFGA